MHNNIISKALIPSALLLCGCNQSKKPENAVATTIEKSPLASTYFSNFSTVVLPITLSSNNTCSFLVHVPQPYTYSNNLGIDFSIASNIVLYLASQTAIAEYSHTLFADKYTHYNTHHTLSNVFVERDLLASHLERFGAVPMPYTLKKYFPPVAQFVAKLSENSEFGPEFRAHALQALPCQSPEEFLSYSLSRLTGQTTPLLEKHAILSRIGDSVESFSTNQLEAVFSILYRHTDAQSLPMLFMNLHRLSNVPSDVQDIVLQVAANQDEQLQARMIAIGALASWTETTQEVEDKLPGLIAATTPLLIATVQSNSVDQLNFLRSAEVNQLLYNLPLYLPALAKYGTSECLPILSRLSTSKSSHLKSNYKALGHTIEQLLARKQLTRDQYAIFITNHINQVGTAGFSILSGISPSNQNSPVIACQLLEQYYDSPRKWPLFHTWIKNIPACQQQEQRELLNNELIRYWKEWYRIDTQLSDSLNDSIYSQLMLAAQKHCDKDLLPILEEYLMSERPFSRQQITLRTIEMIKRKSKSNDHIAIETFTK